MKEDEKQEKRAEELMDSRPFSPTDIKDLIPMTVGLPKKAKPIALKERMTDDKIKQIARSSGCAVDEVPIKLYHAGSLGTTRQLSNQDLLTGWSPLYDDLSHFRLIYSKLEAIVGKMREFYEPSIATSAVSNMEMEDLVKITIQRVKHPGWMKRLTFKPEYRRLTYPKEFLTIVDQVVRKYVEVLPKPFRNLSMQQGVLWDSDPPDTSTGMPSMKSGDETQAARIMALRAIEFRGTPDLTLAGIERLSSMFGLPRHGLYSCTIASRWGPTNSAVKVWEEGLSTSSEMWETESIYAKMRLVFPVAHFVNVLLASLYVAMHTSRQHMPGMWHDSNSWKIETSLVGSQGKHNFASDVSGMDRSITNTLINVFAASAVKYGLSPWGARFLAAWYERFGVYYPSLSGNPSGCTLISGWNGVVSGMKPTSEIDTIFAIASTLYVLLKWDSRVVQRWLEGTFTILAQGDDVLFSWKTPIDPDQYKARGAEIGFDLKPLTPNVMFLKNFLPLTAEVPKKTRPLSRLLQQTFFNEDKYDGVKGGAKPDALLRLALMARMDSLPDHPHFKKWWPDISEAILSLGYAQRSSEAWRSALRSGRATLEPGDPQAILSYSLQFPNFLANIEERAKFEHSSLILLGMLNKLGIKSGQTGEDVRKNYLTSLLSTPTSADIQAFLKLKAWA